MVQGAVPPSPQLALNPQNLALDSENLYSKNLTELVELWGFEPQTSSMPWTHIPSAEVLLGRVCAVQGGSTV
jgi:hypothetical protein